MTVVAAKRLRLASFRTILNIAPPLPRKSVLILLPLFAILLSLAPVTQAQAPTLGGAGVAHLRATTLGISFSITSGTPDKYEARLGTGAWRDVTSSVWQAGRAWFYIATGVQPATEYTLSLRASTGSNTGAHISVTATTLSRANDYNARFCRDNGVNKLLLIGLGSPGNASASYEFELWLSLFEGQAFRRIRQVVSISDIPKSTREVTVGAVAPSERLYGNLIQLLDGSSNSYLALQLFGSDALPACYPSSSSDSSSSTKSSSSSSSSSSRPTIPPPTPIPDTLNYLPPEIEVTNWVDGAQGRRVGAEGVGRADLIAAGILDAVDIWSYVTPDLQVCFAQAGNIVFLDAAYSPRKLVDLPEHSREGWPACTLIDRAGTVVLLQSAAPPPPASTAVPSQALSGCQVKPWADLNFRESPPAGAVIGVTNNRDWLPASEKSAGYFKVRLWGREGWLSGDYVFTHGQCG